MRLRQLYLFVSAVLTSAALLCATASLAFALPDRFFGMMAHESMNNSDPDWDALQKAGVQRFRMEIKWSKVVAAGNWREPYAWEATYDQYFEKAAKRGIEILPYLYTRKSGSSEYYLLSETGNYSEWLEFVGYVVRRYGQAGSFWVYHPNLPQYPVKVWEVWNEPNLNINCPSQSCNGKLYGELLVGTATRIRNAQENIYPFNPTVLFGGLYQERWNYPVTNYLSAAGLAPGIKTAYDGLSLHPYALGKEGEGVTRTYPEKAAGVPSNIDEAYNAQYNGIWVLKPIWVTEVGWPITGTGAQHVNTGEQAGLLEETYNWLKQNTSAPYNIRYVAWYLYRDINDPRWQYNAGLRDATGGYRPSWYAYQRQAGVQEWPPYWHTENFGGMSASDPESCSWGSGRTRSAPRPI